MTNIVYPKLIMGWLRARACSALFAYLRANCHHAGARIEGRNVELESTPQRFGTFICKPEC